MLTLPIEIGKMYVRRDGFKVVALESAEDIGAGTCYVGTNPTENQAGIEGRKHVFLDSGRGSRGKLTSSGDLIADAFEYSATPVEADPNGLHPNSPGAKLDAGKVRPALVLGGHARALLEVAKVGTGGAIKYTDDGWMHVANGIKRYDDAMLRHWLKEKAGEECDADTGLLHAAHLAWNALSRLDLLIREKEKQNGQ